LEPSGQLAANKAKIMDELVAAQGTAVDMGDYYHAPQDVVSAVIRPSSTLNAIID
jgi:isocitrate dehydrogenase